MMEHKILFVDDDLRFLSSIKRSMGRQFSVVTAESSPQALELMQQQEFAVIVSDMKMPGITGIELLCRVKDRSPDTVRILLTGFADQQTAIDAVNQGEIFRFLSKPCDPGLLARILDDALRQNHLITAEREVLEKTLLGIIQVLSQILSQVNPSAQRRSNRLKYYSRRLAIALDLQGIWFFEMSALLSQIGCLIVPGDTLNEYLADRIISAEERSLIEEHPAMAEDLLRHVPRLEEVAQSIALQNQPFQFFTAGTDPEMTTKTALAAQILHVALELDRLSHNHGLPLAAVKKQLLAQPEEYNPEVVARLAAITLRKEARVAVKVMAKDLTLSMFLSENIYTKTGVMLAAKDQELSDFMLMGIKRYAKTMGVREPFTVLAPVEFAAKQ